MSAGGAGIEVRRTRSVDFPQIIEMCREVYPGSRPWSEDQLASHLRVFPEGQLVAVETTPGRVAGMAASLIVRWDDYDFETSWRDFTDHGMFTNHDPDGRTLYGAEVMVRPGLQGRGIGSRIYEARRRLVERLGRRRIRAGSRLRGYHRHADRLDPEAYVRKVIRGEIADPTLTFQLRRGFRVLAVVSAYLPSDPASLGHAAIIEWINRRAARPEDLDGADPKFATEGSSG